jgi:hypothetical protein
MRNRFFAVFCVSLSALLGVAACSSDDDDAAAAGPNGVPGPDGRIIHIDELRAQLRPIVDADCQWEFRCCNADERASVLGPMANVAECVDRALAAASRSEYYQTLGAAQTSSAVLGELTRVGYGFDYGRITVDAAAVQACVTKITERACATRPPTDHCAPGEIPPIDDPCAISKLLVGKQKVGEPCTPQSSECTPDLRCATFRGNDGVCVERAKVGETCFRDSECDPKLVCDARVGRCAVGGDVGAACSFDNPDRPQWELTADRCRPGLQCDTRTLQCGAPTCAGGSSCSDDTNCPPDTMCVAGRCGAAVKDGEPCSVDANCINGHCRYDAAHSRSSCASPAPNGGLCQGGRDNDCASHFCDYDSSIGEYVCKPALAAGVACPSGDRECASGRCRLSATNTMECAAPAAVGATCATDLDCSPTLSLYCVNSKCAAPPFDNGAVCTQADECKSKLCTKGKCSAFQPVGAPCGTADVAACDEGLYCSGPVNGPMVCAPKKPHGALCTESQECLGYCYASFGALRCTEGGGEAVCTGQ